MLPLTRGVLKDNEGKKSEKLDQDIQYRHGNPYKANRMRKIREVNNANYNFFTQPLCVAAQFKCLEPQSGLGRSR